MYRLHTENNSEIVRCFTHWFLFFIFTLKTFKVKRSLCSNVCYVVASKIIEHAMCASWICQGVSIIGIHDRYGNFESWQDRTASKHDDDSDDGRRCCYCCSWRMARCLLVIAVVLTVVCVAIALAVIFGQFTVCFVAGHTPGVAVQV